MREALEVRADQLAAVPTPDRDAITTRWTQQIAVIMYAAPFERLTDAQRSICSDIAQYSWVRRRGHAG